MSPFFSLPVKATDEPSQQGLQYTGNQNNSARESRQTTLDYKARDQAAQPKGPAYLQEQC